MPVYVLATLDTKGAEAAYVRDALRRRPSGPAGTSSAVARVAKHAAGGRR